MFAFSHQTNDTVPTSVSASQNTPLLQDSADSDLIVWLPRQNNSQTSDSILTNVSRHFASFQLNWSIMTFRVRIIIQSLILYSLFITVAILYIIFNGDIPLFLPLHRIPAAAKQTAQVQVVGVHNAEYSEEYFLWASDFHLEPYYNENIVPQKPQLVCRDLNITSSCPDISSKNSNFSALHSGKYPYGRYNCDPPEILLVSQMIAMNNLEPNPKFLILTGDFVGHYLPCKKAHLNTLSKAVTVISDHLKIPIIFTLGNVDFYPSYNVGDDKEQLISMSEIFAEKKWLHDPIAVKNFKQGGFYSRVVSNTLRIVSFNSVILSTGLVQCFENYSKYEEFLCNRSLDSKDPYGQFSWIREELEDCRKLKHKVVLISHIAPGKKDYSTNWCSLYKNIFLEILDEFSDIIVAQLYGDHNRDEVRMFLKNVSNVNASIPMSSFGFINPGLTPRRPSIAGALPIFKRVLYDFQNNYIQDILTYSFQLQRGNFYSKTQKRISGHFWNLSYSFRESYGLKDLSKEEMKKFFKSISKSYRTLENYARNQIAGYAGNMDYDDILEDMKVQT